MYGGVINDILVFRFGVSWFSNAHEVPGVVAVLCEYMGGWV